MERTFIEYQIEGFLKIYSFEMVAKSGRLKQKFRFIQKVRYIFIVPLINAVTKVRSNYEMSLQYSLYIH